MCPKQSVRGSARTGFSTAIDRSCLYFSNLARPAFVTALMGHQDALCFKDIPNCPDVALEVLVLMRQTPLPRTRDVDLQVEVDPARARRHHEHAVSEKDRLFDAVGDE